MNAASRITGLLYVSLRGVICSVRVGRQIKFLVMLSLVFGLGFSARADALDTWFVRNSGTTTNLTAVVYGDGNFAVVGNAGTILTSTNGLDWVTRDSGLPPIDILSASYGNGFFVGGGSFYYGPPYGPTNVFVSTNAADWLRVVPGSGTAGTSLGFTCARYAGGLHFLVGSSTTIHTATNIDLSCAGTITNCNWTTRNYGMTWSPRAMAYGNGTYVVVGQAFAMTSTNTITWTSNSISGSWRDVAFGNGVFIAVGDGGSIRTSSDGRSWPIPTNSWSNSKLTRIAFGNGTFVAVGEQGTILTSTNGFSWRKRTPPVATSLAGVAYCNGTFVATGEGGTILQSASVSVPSLAATRDSPGGGIALALAGEIGRSYRIQVSTNLATSGWEDFLAFTNTAPTMEFLDAEAANIPQRFYRALSP